MQFGRRSMLLSPVAAAGLRPRRAWSQTAEGEVVFAGFGGTIEQVFRNKLIPSFERQYGIKVTYIPGTALANYAQLVAARAHPEIDIYWSNELTHVAGKQVGLYEKLDPAIVTNLGELLDLARDPDGIGAVSYIIATAFEYHTDAYAQAGLTKPTSWNDLWNPGLKGKVALLTIDVAATQDLLVILTKLAGGTEADIRPGLDRIKDLMTKGNLTSFASSPAEIDNMIMQRQAWISVASSTRPLILKQRGAPVDVAFPEEGAGFFTNYFDVVTNAPHPRAAQILVNALLGADMQRFLCDDSVAASPNRNVPLPKPLQGVMPPLEGNYIHIDRVVMNRDLDRWVALWNREITSRRG